MKTARSPWLPAAVTAIVVAVAQALTIMHLVPGTTVIDIGALLLTGFLAGLFMGFHIARRQTVSTDQSGRSS